VLPWNCWRARWAFSVENGDFAREDGDLPRENGDFTREIGDLPRENGDFTREIGDLPRG